MHRGYFALWRKFKDNLFWKEHREFSKFEAWLDIITEAQHETEPQDVIIKMTLLKCYYGECLKSTRTWSKRWNWSESKVKRFLKLLKKVKQIEIKSELVTTRLSIINYALYDPRRTENEPQMNRKRTGSEPEVNTDKNDKNVKNEKKRDYPDFLDMKLWQDFKKHRIKLKAPMTDRAEELAIMKLENFKERGFNPNDILKNSIEFGWKGLFEPKEQERQPKPRTIDQLDIYRNG